MMKKALIASTAVAGLFSGVASAELTGSIGVASSYVFRGDVEAEPQVSGSLDYAHASGFYAGTWIANSSLGNGEELDLYAGFTLDLGEGIGLDIGAIAYLFPSDGETTTINTSHGNNTEAYIGLGGQVWDVYAWYNFGADSEEEDEFAYIEANAELPVSQGSSLGLHLGVKLGIGDQFDSGILEDREDGAVDVAISYNVGDFAATVSSKFDDTDIDTDNRNRPQFSVSWNKEFDIK